MAVSLLEYLMHRYYLHIKTHSHIIYHHKVFNTKTNNFYNTESDFKSIASSFAYLTSMAVLTTMILFPALIYFKLNLLVSFIIIVLYILWTEVLHFFFHTKHISFISETFIYKNLENHHKIHHSSYNTNFGIGSTQIDYIFNTKFKNN